MTTPLTAPTDPRADLLEWLDEAADRIRTRDPSYANQLCRLDALIRDADAEVASLTAQLAAARTPDIFGLDEQGYSDDDLSDLFDRGNTMGRGVVRVWAERNLGHRYLVRVPSLDHLDEREIAVCQTEEEARALTAAEPIESLAQLHQAWSRKLARPQWRILEAVLAEHPASIDRDELAARAGQSPSSSGYANNLGALRSLGLIDRQPGRVGATGLLYPEGLA